MDRIIKNVVRDEREDEKNDGTEQADRINLFWAVPGTSHCHHSTLRIPLSRLSLILFAP
jgi:hypothetical protein